MKGDDEGKSKRGRGREESKRRRVEVDEMGIKNGKGTREETRFMRTESAGTCKR